MFENREDAGLILSHKLKIFFDNKNCICLGLTRGGVITAKIISTYLHIPLEALVVKKIGIPGNNELAIGAIVSPDIIYWDLKILKRFHISEKEKHTLFLKKLKEVEKLGKALKISKNKDKFKDKTVILVDDGVATGATVMAASLYLRKQKAKRIILATPVIARDTFEQLKQTFDKIITIKKPSNFSAVSQFYRNFKQVTDKEVVDIFLQT